MFPWWSFYCSYTYRSLSCCHPHPFLYSIPDGLWLPAHSDSVFVFILGCVILTLGWFIFTCEFCKEHLGLRCRLSAILAWLPAIRDGLFLRLEELSCTSLQGPSPMGFFQTLNSSNSTLLKSRIVILLFALFPFFGILNCIILWLLQGYAQLSHLKLILPCL